RARPQSSRRHHHDQLFALPKEIVKRVGEVKFDNFFREIAQAKWIAVAQLPDFFQESSIHSVACDLASDRDLFQLFARWLWERMTAHETLLHETPTRV